jgi:hypothetical protein
MDIQECAWDDCEDVADYSLRFADRNQRVDDALAVCVVHLADGIVSMFERLRLEGLDGVVVQVSLAD